MKTLTILASVIWLAAGSVRAVDRTVMVDVSDDLGAIDFVLGTNCGPLSMSGDEDFTQLFRELGLSVIRTHDFYGPCDWNNIFPDWSRDPDDPDAYDFTASDAKMAAIVSNGFDVMYRLGVSWNDPNFPYHTDPPGTVRNAQGDIIHQADADDFAKFAQICVHIVKHYNEGWADGFFYGIESWEIWNEPAVSAHFWMGTPEQFYLLFESVAKALKNYDADLRVGGPGQAGGVDGDYREGLLAHCAANQVPLDFYSWHSYGTISRSPRIVSPEAIARTAREARDLLDGLGYFETESICTEWNADLNEYNFAGRPAGAAYYACALVNMIENGVTECYQYRADDHPLGLITAEGNLKIAAETLRAFHRMTTNAHRLFCSGTDETGFAAFATWQGTAKRLNVLLANASDADDHVRLDIENLSGLGSGTWLLTKLGIDGGHRLEVMDEMTIDSGASITLDQLIPSSTTILLELVLEQDEPDLDHRYAVPVWHGSGAAWTGLALLNPDELVNAVVVTYLTSDGTVVQEDSWTADPWAQTTILTPASQMPGWIEIRAEAAINGLALWGKYEPEILIDLDIQDVSAGDQTWQVLFPHLSTHSGTWNSFLLAANPNESPVDVEVVYTSTEGVILAQARLSMPARTSARFDLMEELGADLRGGSIRLSAPRPVAAFLLFDGTQQGFNWQAGFSPQAVVKP